MNGEEHRASTSLTSTGRGVPASLDTDSLALGAALGAVALGAVGLIRVFRDFRTRAAARDARDGGRETDQPVSYRYEYYSYTRIEIVETAVRRSR